MIVDHLTGLIVPAHRPARTAPLPAFEKPLRLANGKVLSWIQPFGNADAARQPGDVAGGVWGRNGNQMGLRVIVSHDYTDKWGVMLHASLSLPNRLPNWDEVRAVKDAVFGEQVDVMMVLPKAADYVNHHEYTFHLWQTPEHWDMQ
jgi:hypothetical protein